MIELFPILQQSKQVVFDTVVDHLKRQGMPSARPNGVCLYRLENQLMCAAGCLIPEGQYSPAMENTSWHTLVENHMVPDAHKFMISDLQSIHDNWADKHWSVEQMLEKFKSYAERSELAWNFGEIK